MVFNLPDGCRAQLTASDGRLCLESRDSKGVRVSNFAPPDGSITIAGSDCHLILRGEIDLASHNLDLVIEARSVELGQIVDTGAGNQIYQGVVSLCEDAVLNAGNVFFQDLVNLGSHELKIRVCETEGIAKGEIRGAGSISKSGAGTFTLAADNSYAGATSIEAGTLAVFGKIGSAGAADLVTLETGTTLTGAGAVFAPIDGAEGSSIVAAGTLTLGNPKSDGFVTDGVLNIGKHAVTIYDANLAQIGSATLLDGGALIAPNGIAMLSRNVLCGQGTIQGKMVVKHSALSADLARDEAEMPTVRGMHLGAGAVTLEISGEVPGNDLVDPTGEDGPFAATLNVASSSNGVDLVVVGSDPERSAQFSDLPFGSVVNIGGSRFRIAREEEEPEFSLPEILRAFRNLTEESLFVGFVIADEVAIQELSPNAFPPSAILTPLLAGVGIPGTRVGIAIGDGLRGVPHRQSVEIEPDGTWQAAIAGLERWDRKPQIAITFTPSCVDDPIKTNDYAFDASTLPNPSDREWKVGDMFGFILTPA